MPVKDYIDNLSLRERAKTMAFIDLLETKGPDLRKKMQGGNHNEV